MLPSTQVMQTSTIKRALQCIRRLTMLLKKIILILTHVRIPFTPFAQVCSRYEKRNTASKAVKISQTTKLALLASFR